MSESLCRVAALKVLKHTQRGLVSGGHDGLTDR